MGKTMMTLRWTALLLFLLAMNARAYELPIEIFEYVDNTKVVAFIHESDLGEATRWHPFKEAPPLAVKDVATAVDSYIKVTDTLKGAILEEIVLRKMPRHEGQWHYMVKLKTEKDDVTRYHYLVVLMNGKIIPAMREPESIK